MASPVFIRVEKIAALPIEEAQRDLLRHLGEQERDTFQALKIPKRQMEWLAGRLLVKELYRKVIDQSKPFNQIQIGRLDAGQPILLTDGQQTDVTISISHSNWWVAAALDPLGQPIGIDLEQVELRDEAFLTDYFTANERNWIENSPEFTRVQNTTLIWSCKESVLKALGQGLHIDLLRIKIGEIVYALSPGSFGSAHGRLQLDEGADQYILKWQLRDEMVFTFASSDERECNVL